MFIRPLRFSLAGALVMAFVIAAPRGQHPAIGYEDTPRIPGSKWRVHDGKRPQPRVVTPGDAGSNGAPADAIVLFDGVDLSKWRGRDGDAKWKVENGNLEVTPTGDLETVDTFGDCQLHIEWAVPADSKGESQAKGNSGVFMMGRYEIQVLDSHGNITYPDGQAAALYGQSPPLVNASRPAGEWQTYDIVFEAPRFVEGKLERPAYVTLFHNGVLVHHHKAMLGATCHRSLATYAPHGPTGPIRLQDHGAPVRYRNIWVRRLKGYDE